MSWRSGWFLDCAPKTLVCSSGTVIPVGGYYFEVTITGTAAFDGGILVGVANRGTILNGIIASGINLAQPNSTGSVFFTSSIDPGFAGAAGWGYPTRCGGMAYGATAVPRTFGVALSTLHKKLWFKNQEDVVHGWSGGSTSNGDPATNNDGADLAALGVTGNIYIVVGALHHGIGVVNFGATAFAQAAPTGFFSVESASPGAQLNPSDKGTDIVLSGGNLTFNGTAVPVAFTPPIAGFSNNVGYTEGVRSRFCFAQ